ncbi:trehalose-phosphatase [Duganella phyllosphaerae]|uniref:Trehalose 6-phosphate phosphatase n=1 Tax=Duganella phyllosphaerae TaxID=762836 RepID=A0A1E7WE08_9BURK|nr:trehalose-phosphatase [Duganella phyllosphaerae]OEZ96253.1 trehalose-6-phosphate phosphatase [Duganella phyllosphaerae]
MMSTEVEKFDLAEWLDGAVFLDFDGTLVDLAETPDTVMVAPGLVQVLATLRERLQGRLAIVSGRPIAQIDAMLAPLKLPVAGVHGAERRDYNGQLHIAKAPSLDAAQLILRALVLAHDGLLLEEKRGALALHYRLAPDLRVQCEQAMEAALIASPGTVLLHGKMVLELKPATVNKGSAVAEFLQEEPFKNCLPVFVGDDTTDEAGIAYAQQLGGVGVKVGAGPSAARCRLDSPQALHVQLAHAAQSNHSTSTGDTP